MARKGRKIPKPGPRIPKDPRPQPVPVWKSPGRVGRPGKEPGYHIPTPVRPPKSPVWKPGVDSPYPFGPEAGKSSFRGFGPR